MSGTSACWSPSRWAAGGSQCGGSRGASSSRGSPMAPARWRREADGPHSLPRRRRMTFIATDRTDALAERLVSATLGALELCSVYLGSELGLYATLEREGALTPAELAQRAGIAPRYAREWLEQQSVAGFLEAHDGRFALPPEHARVLTRAGDPAHAAPFAHMLAGVGGVLTQVAAAYRSGGGVPYEAYGAAFRHGQGQCNRPAFTHELPTAWLGAMPDVVAHLQEAGGRVADVGCGRGGAGVAGARASPGATVDGIALDAASVQDAPRHAAEA